MGALGMMTRTIISASASVVDRSGDLTC